MKVKNQEIQEIFDRINVHNNLLQELGKDVRFIKDFIMNKYAGEKIVRTVIIDGEPYFFEDALISNSVVSIADEINAHTDYDFAEIDFKPGDVVLDIGGNIGMVSIYLAKKFPFLKIYAFEPVKENYESFKNNIKLNNVPNGVIMLNNMAVTKDGRDIIMNINPLNRGGSAISDIFATNYHLSADVVKSISLEEIFKQNDIKQLKMLKIDCEGSEYEILYNTPTDLLTNIEYLRGEFHENKRLTDKYDIDKLEEYVSRFIKNVKVQPGRECFVIE